MNALIDLLKIGDTAQQILLEDACYKITGKYLQPILIDEEPRFFHKVTSSEKKLTVNEMKEMDEVAYLFHCASNCKSIAEKERLLPQLGRFIEIRRTKSLFLF